ncbi:flagellar biosynthesis repressor FlbT [Paracoccus zhejiangensis]|uniref:Flagellar biosynthesis repressor FlbT n=1 Tax=Paracoccus zhejiangensis TaxID=1077935 RepID=A0A2H5EZP7_9RHOB|nr:flagellar biosynthesis repressor FlbT [Paracoccus zhejiangensis]AUH64778.1 flagellar biosynthesis repressor FlbT [Paracoccus zhejiangensis]
MSGLVIKLAPKERILINGAVIENGDKRSKIAIKTPNANVLRLKDAIHPEAVRSPVARVCYVAQLILSGDTEPDEGGRQLLRGIEQLSQVFDDPDSRRLLAAASQSALSGNAYQALRRLRDLLPREARMLSARPQ